MNARTQTIIVSVAAAIGLIAWDIIVLLNNTEGDTISNVIYDGSQYAAAIPYACGALCTHWFWPTRRHLLPIPYMASILIAGATLVTAAGWVLGHPEWWGLLSLVTGGAAGKLWPNKVRPTSSDG